MNAYLEKHAWKFKTVYTTPLQIEVHISQIHIFVAILYITLVLMFLNEEINNITGLFWHILRYKQTASSR